VAHGGGRRRHRARHPQRSPLEPRAVWVLQPRAILVQLEGAGVMLASLEGHRPLEGGQRPAERPRGTTGITRALAQAAAPRPSSSGSPCPPTRPSSQAAKGRHVTVEAAGCPSLGGDWRVRRRVGHPTGAPTSPADCRKSVVAVAGEGGGRAAFSARGEDRVRGVGGLVCAGDRRQLVRGSVE
jgi:hypothetical protein